MVTTEELYSIFEQCTGVTTDSRRIAEGALFVALRGENFDGNAFVVDALRRGAAYALTDSETPAAEAPELAGRIVRTDDTLRTLQELAREHRRRLAIPIIGIVGSNGKTTTKELVSRVLAEKFAVQATTGNLNNHIGVPLTLLAITHRAEFGVVEMGASACGEIASLCAIAEPNYGIITNIGRAHLEGFGGVAGIRRGKGELFDFLQANGGRAFIPREDEVLADMAAERPDMAAEYYSRTIADGMESHLSGEYNRANIAAAVAVGRYFDIDDTRIAAAIASYEPDNNRSQIVESGRNRIIADCYNANPSSMQAAIENIAAQSGEHKVLILGDMFELGEWSHDEHRRIVRTVAETLPLARAIFVGQAFCEAVNAEGGPNDRRLVFATTSEAADFLAAHPLQGAAVLVKGSRGMALEKVLTLL